MDLIERVLFLFMFYRSLIEFNLINSTFIVEFIILIQTKLKWSGLFDFDNIFTPKVKLTQRWLIFNILWHPLFNPSFNLLTSCWIIVVHGLI